MRNPERSNASVQINLYDLGTAAQLLNRMLPDNLGIFHTAVEVYDYEWSFAYLGDRIEEKSSPGEDPSAASKTTGVLQCRPRKLRSYMYRESIEVGRTHYSESEVKQIVRRLCFDWRSSSYHITRRNCLMFSEALVEKLGLAASFPAWLKTVYEKSNGSPTLSALVDLSWTASKWMIKARMGSSYASEGPAVRMLCSPCYQGDACNEDFEDVGDEDGETTKVDPGGQSRSISKAPPLELNDDDQSDNETVFNYQRAPKVHGLSQAFDAGYSSSSATSARFGKRYR